MKTTIAVVTQVPAIPEHGSNRAACFAYRKGEREPCFEALHTLETDVFVLGEILILGSDAREVSGKGRKPSKWDVAYEEFDSIEEAAIRAREVRTW